MIKPSSPVSQPASTSAEAPVLSSAEEFFLPNLCHVQAVLFLILVAQLLAIVLELAATGLAAFSWASLSLTSLFVQWCFLLNAALLCILRPRLARWPLPRAAACSYVLIITVVSLTTLLAQWLHPAQRGWDGNALLTNMLICAVLAGIALRYFYLTQQLQLRQRAELQARIQALQSRIRPHFLFNSMNIIASLIAVDQSAAEAAVEDLSSLFRASLAEVETEVTLADELALCEGYVRIEQLRLGARLRVDWELADVPLQLPIPSLSLQPLLENAIYHGIQQLPAGGTVIIKGSYSNKLLRISITNPLPQRPMTASTGNHLALDNIRQRLQALYGNKAALNIVQDAAQYQVEMVYPVTVANSKTGAQP